MPPEPPPDPASLSESTTSTHVDGELASAPAGARLDPPSTTTTFAPSPPPLSFTFHWLRPSLYVTFLFLCNVLIPCLVFYLLKYYTTVSKQTLIGISSGALGVSSCFDAPFRLYKLIRFHDKFGPLNDAKWYHLDFFMWSYTLALFVFALPLAIAPAIPVYSFFLLSPALLIAPVGILFLVSLRSWKTRAWISSEPPGTPTKPATFYFLEDLVAVDFGRGRTWRKQLYTRYEASAPFRSLMWWLTLYWVVQVIIYIAACCAVIWSTTITVSYGFVLGFFFLWAWMAGVGCWLVACKGLRIERDWWGKSQGIEPVGKAWN